MNAPTVEPSAFPHGPTVRRVAPSPDLPAGVSCEVIVPGQPGMTLRDYFAATVLGSLSLQMLDRLGLHTVPAMVGTCYRIADEMLAFRSAGQPAPRS